MWIDEFIIITSNTDAFSIEFSIESIYILRMGFLCIRFCFCISRVLSQTDLLRKSDIRTQSESCFFAERKKNIIAIIHYKRPGHSGSDPLSGLFCCHWHHHFGQHHKISYDHIQIDRANGKWCRSVNWPNGIAKFVRIFPSTVCVYTINSLYYRVIISLCCIHL